MIPRPGAITEAALAAAQARNVDGIAFVLTPADPFIVMDLGNCRHPRTRSIDIWAQNFLDVTSESYAEATPSGDGIMIWGLTRQGRPAEVNWKFALEIDGKAIAVELFRYTREDPARHWRSARRCRGSWRTSIMGLTGRWHGAIAARLKLPRPPFRSSRRLLLSPA